MLPNQTMLDVVLTKYGTMECGMAFLQANNCSIADTVVVGTVYNAPVLADSDAEALAYLRQKGVVIGTKG